VENYMARHINGNGCHKNCERYGRIHVYNGGPRGCTNPSTMGYWNKIVSKGGLKTRTLYRKKSFAIL
jgi:hypothetical protein